ncbi:MAG: von Willebrand factor type A domain-containing protein, partial [Bacteroidia bacterium]|nr:von Willebrand factor type A domain-containing protein [Bacteroidia bacterium]
FGLILCQSVYAQLQTGIIRGTVTDESTGNIIAYANVALLQGGNTINSVQTDIGGNFLFNSINTGSYTVKVNQTGYDEFVQKNVKVTGGNTTLLYLKLKNTTLLSNLIIMPDSASMPPASTVKTKKDSRDYFARLDGRIAGEGKKCERAAASYCQAIAGQAYQMPAGDFDGYLQDGEFNTEEFDKITENIFLEALTNPLSTFSVDVDRAAYSNIRRYLNYNQLPPKDLVRIEEMINYFDYTYFLPNGDHPFSVYMEYGDCPWNATHKLLHIGLKGKEFGQEKIPPSNLVFLLDVSGSMSDANKLPLLKQAFKILIEKLRPEDRVAIVVYAGAAGLVLEPTSGADKEKIINALDKLQAGGSTAGGAGINLAYQIAKNSFIKNGNNRVILATDGDFNIGQSSDGDMVRLIEEKRKDGIFISILGFGMGNYKDSKMEKIADAGNGNYAYIDNILEAKKMFGEELWGTLYTIAKDVKIQIEFNPSKVKAYRLVGYENRMLRKEDFNDDKKDAGEIGAGHTVTALYEIILAGSQETTGNVDKLEYQNTNVVQSNDLMTLKLRYKLPDADTSKLIVERVSENNIKNRQMSENFRFSAAVAEFGILLRDSEFKANATFDQTLELARNAKGIDKYGYRAEFIKLVEVAKILSNPETATK